MSEKRQTVVPGREIWVEVREGAAIRPVMSDLARLRIKVFREWPYLYAGTVEYEERYLEVYARCVESCVVLVWDGDRVVGASTALPMAAADQSFQAPFFAQGHGGGADLLFWGVGAASGIPWFGNWEVIF